MTRTFRTSSREPRSIEPAVRAASGKRRLLHLFLGFSACEPLMGTDFDEFHPSSARAGTAGLAAAGGSAGHDEVTGGGRATASASSAGVGDTHGAGDAGDAGDAGGGTGGSSGAGGASRAGRAWGEAGGDPKAGDGSGGDSGSAGTSAGGVPGNAGTTSAGSGGSGATAGSDTNPWGREATQVAAVSTGNGQLDVILL
ncbi:MAG TPA: hypothetical protein VGK73_03295, partial [Polyangiaceae bacterium]